MVNQKLTALNEITSPLLDDILYLVTDPATTKVPKKVTLDSLIRASLLFGHLYVKNGTGSQALTASSAVKVDQLNVDGYSRGVTTDAVDSVITLDTSGAYLLFFSVTFVGTAACKYKFRGRMVSAGTLGETETEFTPANSTDVYHVSSIGTFIGLAPDDVYIDVLPNANSVLDVKTAHLIVVRLGPPL